MKVSRPIPAPPHAADLERYAVLGPLPESAFDRPLRLAARLLRAPVALLTLGHGEPPWFQGGVGEGWRRLPGLPELHAATLDHPEGVVVTDLARDAGFAACRRAPGELAPRFYAGVPLVAPDGRVLGTLGVLDVRPRAPRSGGEPAVLGDLAALAVDELEGRLRTWEVEREGRARAEARRRFQEDLTLSQLLRGVSDLTALGLAPEDLLRRVADLAAPVLGADWVGLTAVEGDRATTTPLWHSPRGAGYDPAAEPHGDGLIRRAAHQTGVCFGGDDAGPPGAPCAASAWLGEAGLPGHVVTLVRLGDDGPWSAWDRRFMEAVVRALHHRGARPGARRGDQEPLQQALEEAQRARGRAEVLLELSQLLEGEGDVKQIAPFALAAVGRALGDGWQVLWRREGEVFRPLAVHGSPPEAVQRRQQAGVPASHYEALGVLAGHRVFLNAESLSEVAWQNGLRGTAALPVLLRLPGQELILGAYRGGEFGAWSPFERDLLITAGRILRAGAERQLRLQDLAAAAHTDPLTGLGNRRAFTAHLEAELEDAARRGGRVGVLSIDLDGLKAVNDGEGHLRGDALLAEFARALRERFRPQDQPYRLGGDEYAVVLTGVTPHEGPPLLARVEAVVRQVRRAGFAYADASAGLACFPADGTDLRTLIEVSDARMYAAKGEKRRVGASPRRGAR
ncbi:sensor domain-containing diguanylate cyclase [Deinococcus aestuarii]|uniref:sensor domain-containing diguanylate cyclase n=1 Tax=Deinococcus aestuarii TaxID=2774531 RepID=UPI001C0B581D|nr:sensor domain-containing diguanylate cyclase [Deinococcus aestuarii]